MYAPTHCNTVPISLDNEISQSVCRCLLVIPNTLDF